MKSADFLNYILSFGILLFIALASFVLIEILAAVRKVKSTLEEVRILARRGQYEAEKMFSFFMPFMKFLIKVRR